MPDTGSLLAIKYERGKLELLDQRLLPFESTYILVESPQAAHDAIRSMVVRGAPAIGCTAALATAAWLVQQGGGSQFDSAADAASVIQRELEHLVTRCLQIPAFHWQSCGGVHHSLDVSLADWVLNSAAWQFGIRSPAADCTGQRVAMKQQLSTLVWCSRPTAVNLQDACQALSRTAGDAAAADGASPQDVAEAVIKAAEAYFQADVATCKVSA